MKINGENVKRSGKMRPGREKKWWDWEDKKDETRSFKDFLFFP